MPMGIAWGGRGGSRPGAASCTLLAACSTGNRAMERAQLESALLCLSSAVGFRRGLSPHLPPQSPSPVQSEIWAQGSPSHPSTLTCRDGDLLLVWQGGADQASAFHMLVQEQEVRVRSIWSLLTPPWLFLPLKLLSCISVNSTYAGLGLTLVLRATCSRYHQAM